MLVRPTTILAKRLSLLALSLILCLGFAGPALADTPAAGDSAPQKSAGPTTVNGNGPSGISSMPRLGLEILDTTSTVQQQTAQETGVGFVRIYFSWSRMEPNSTEPATYNWSSYDPLFLSLAQKGVGTIALVDGCPQWACPHRIGPLYEDRYDDFARFMQAAAARYSQAPYNVHYWEMWNEPDDKGDADGSTKWGQHPDKYVKMLAAAYPAIKAVDPQSVVMSGGLAYDNFESQGGPFVKEFLPTVLDLGGAQYMDAIAFHYYLNNGHGWTNLGIKGQELRALLAQKGTDLPIICTEYGLTSTSHPEYGIVSSEAIQARYLVQSNVHGTAGGLHAQVWFTAQDFESNVRGWKIFKESGLLRVNNTHKPSYFAMKVLAREVGSGRYLGQMNASNGLSGGLEGYYFKSPDFTKKVAVVWNSNASGVETLTIPASDAVDLARVIDLYGNAVATQAGPGGTVLVSVGQDPVYVVLNRRFEDVPRDMWAFDYIEYLASRSIIGGYADGNFRPNDNATRGQFSKMVAVGMGWNLLNPARARFADVPPGSPFFTYIETAADRGIIGGYPCGGTNPETGQAEPCPGNYFRPGNKITRGQIVKIVVLSKGWTLINPATPSFKDVPRSNTFYTAVETAVSKGIINGYQCGAAGEPCPGGYFRSSTNATRAQLSKILALALQQP